MLFYDFNEMATSRPTVAGAHLEVERLHFKTNEGAPEHAHPNEQIMYVVKGKLRVRFGEEIGEIGPGQAFLAPANVKHHVTALEDTEVISCKNIIEGYTYKVPGLE